MRRFLTLLVIAGWLAPMPFIAACDRTVEHEKSTEVKDNGATVTKEKKVTENPNNGTMTKTEEKKVDNP